MGNVNNDEMDRDTGVSKPNATGSRMVMMRDVHIFRCINVGVEQSWIRELPQPLFFHPF